MRLPCIVSKLRQKHFNGHRLSVMEDGRVSEMDGGDGGGTREGTNVTEL